MYDENASYSISNSNLTMYKKDGNALTDNFDLKVPHKNITKISDETLYSVIYDEQGGLPVSNSGYRAGEAIDLPPPTTRTGYTFTGWFTSSTGGTALTSPYSPP
mgnify:FL=1